MQPSVTHDRQVERKSPWILSLTVPERMAILDEMSEFIRQNQLDNVRQNDVEPVPRRICVVQLPDVNEE